jgi:hypothetical protein
MINGANSMEGGVSVVLSVHYSRQTSPLDKTAPGFKGHAVSAEGREPPH